jgi:hypothetical protein
LKEKIFEYRCYKCNNVEWLGQPISLELEHKNGNHFDNRLENLTILCPNCHAQTETYCSKNKRVREHPKDIEKQKDVSKQYKKTKKYKIYDNFEKVSDMLKSSSINKVAKIFCVNESIIRNICKEKNFIIPNKYNRKFEVSKEELEKMVQTMPMTKIGEHFGVSDKAIVKRCEKLSIEIPKNRRGYWAKIYAGKKIMAQ